MQDQHDPTRAIEPGILRLFRVHRDPVLLASQFQPLFRRAEFLISLQEGGEVDDMAKRKKELISFVEVLEMGSYYGQRIDELFGRFGGVWVVDDPDNERKLAEDLQRRLQRARENAGEILALVVELVRFQPWGTR
ncbi:MAG: hypothetical protein R3E10_02660 [Gemmatimonadota bacterium]